MLIIYCFRFAEDCGAVFPPNSPLRTLPVMARERKKWDRFNGMTVDEVKLRTLPDHLAPNLDIIIVSYLINLLHYLFISSFLLLK
jgi:hypothetical protein